MEQKQQLQPDLACWQVQEEEHQNHQFHLLPTTLSFMQLCTNRRKLLHLWEKLILWNHRVSDAATDFFHLKKNLEKYFLFK